MHRCSAVKASTRLGALATPNRKVRNLARKPIFSARKVPGETLDLLPLRAQANMSCLQASALRARAGELRAQSKLLRHCVRELRTPTVIRLPAKRAAASMSLNTLRARKFALRATLNGPGLAFGALQTELRSLRYLFQSPATAPFASAFGAPSPPAHRRGCARAGASAVGARDEYRCAPPILCGLAGVLCLTYL